MKIVKTVLAFLLIFCLLPLPYWYYEFIRIATILVFGIIAYINFRRQNLFYSLLSIAVIILFQPIAKIPLQLFWWYVADISLATMLLYNPKLTNEQA